MIIIAIIIGLILHAIAFGCLCTALSSKFSSKKAPYFVLGFTLGAFGLLLTAIEAYGALAKKQQKQLEYLNALYNTMQRLQA